LLIDDRSRESAIGRKSPIKNQQRINNQRSQNLHSLVVSYVRGYAVSGSEAEERMAQTSLAARVLLWLFVINLGTAFGAGLYEHRIVVPEWVVANGAATHWNAEAARRDDTGLRFWAYVTTGPLTLLTLLNLVAAWRATGPIRRWWLAAALAILVDRVLTLSYFIPTMIGLMSAADSPASVSIATRWAAMNYIRHALTLGGWLAALKTFSLTYSTTRD
jgi:hypothetical protein